MLSIKIVIMFLVGIVAMSVFKPRGFRFKKKGKDYVSLNRIIDRESFVSVSKDYTKNSRVIN